MIKERADIVKPYVRFSEIREHSAPVSSAEKMEKAAPKDCLSKPCLRYFTSGHFWPCFSATWMRIMALMSSTRAFS
jgi:hypothetical protein